MALVGDTMMICATFSITPFNHDRSLQSSHFTDLSIYRECFFLEFCLKDCLLRAQVVAEALK